VGRRLAVWESGVGDQTLNMRRASQEAASNIGGGDPTVARAQHGPFEGHNTL